MESDHDLQQSAELAARARDGDRVALGELLERLAENAHDHWATLRLERGWRWGPMRDDEQKTHPDLVPFAELPESEKDFDRRTAEETLKAIVALGYEISRRATADGD